MTQGGPQFPDPLGAREVIRPGATAHKAGLDTVRRVAALEQGAASRERPCLYYAKMSAANSGAPTHTSSGGWQKVGSGGGTLTWTNEFDIYPVGSSAQVDTVTNKRITIRKTGVYRVTWGGAFTSITDAKTVNFAVYNNGALMYGCQTLGGVAGVAQANRVEVVSLTSGDYLELFANQNDSASEAYFTSAGYTPHLSIQYVGPAS